MTSADLAALRRRAATLGVEVSYRDVAGHVHDTAPSTLQAVVDVLAGDRVDAGRHLPPVVTHGPVPVGAGVTGAMVTLADGHDVPVPVKDDAVVLPPDLPIGCHELAITGLGVDETATLIVAPDRMPRAAALAGSAGLFVPAYALWSVENPLPSFLHLADLAARLPAKGARVLSTLPLYAGFLDEPFDASPYAPISRLHWNEVYLDDRDLPPATDGDPAGSDRAGGEHVAFALGPLVDWRALARRRRRQLLAAARDGLPHAGRPDVLRFVTANPDVVAYARFRADHPDPADAGHPRPLVEASHVLAQLLAERQLATVEQPGGATLALDLPIGSHPAGFETWAHPERFAGTMAVGAPPDSFFQQGQNWGFPPPLPGAGRRSGHRLWRDLVRRAGQRASMLRIDHVMGVHRLWWIPEGAPATDGCYVRYPCDEILAAIAVEATLAGTTIVGEDLGTVPYEVHEALERWDVLGMHEEQFHVDDRRLPAVPARAVAGIRTHDMPAFAALAGATDLTSYQAQLVQALGHDVPRSAAGLLDGALERLARSEAYSVVADLDDLLGETAPHNVPGQILDTTWRRRLPRPTADVLADAEVTRRLSLLATRRPPR
jgi:4-alpha-glucanotransferase